MHYLFLAPIAWSQTETKRFASSSICDLNCIKIKSRYQNYTKLGRKVEYTISDAEMQVLIVPLVKVDTKLDLFIISQSLDYPNQRNSWDQRCKPYCEFRKEI